MQRHPKISLMKKKTDISSRASAHRLHEMLLKESVLSHT